MKLGKGNLIFKRKYLMKITKMILIGLVIILAFVVTPVYATDSEAPPKPPKAHNDIPTRHDDAPNDTQEDQEDIRHPVHNGEGWEEEPNEDDDTEWNDDQAR